jgi:uncharacterized protein YkwD
MAVICVQAIMSASAPSIRLIALTCVALLALGCSSASATAVEFGSWTPGVKADADILPLEHQLHQRINRDRAAEGLPPLRYDERLADIARAHSADMRDSDFFAHESPTTGLLEDRMVRAGYLATEMRENLALAPDIEIAEDNLLESPGHKANILSTTVSHVGVGIVRGDSDGDMRSLTITQVFATPSELDSPDEALQKVIASMNQTRAGAGLAPMTPHPMLQELADEHIATLPDSVPSSAVDDVGDEVSAELNARKGHALSAISIVGQAVFQGSEFPMPGAAKEAAVRHYGAAAGKAKDDKGRPRVKLLVLLGRAAGR